MHKADKFLKGMQTTFFIKGELSYMQNKGRVNQVNSKKVKG